MRTIFHPTDFSPASVVAFVHALKLAQITGSELTIFAVSEDAAAADEQGFPHVRATLERWGFLPEHSRKEDVGKLGFSVMKVEVIGDDPTTTMLGYLEDRGVDLMVLATAQSVSHSRARRTCRRCSSRQTSTGSSRRVPGS